jgi:hypothetical protein
MRFACQITKARVDKDWKYLILTAFPPQKRLREGAVMLGYSTLAALFSCNAIQIDKETLVHWKPFR